MFVIRVIQRWGISYVTTLRRVHLAQLNVQFSLTFLSPMRAQFAALSTTIHLKS